MHEIIKQPDVTNRITDKADTPRLDQESMSNSGERDLSRRELLGMLTVAGTALSPAVVFLVREARLRHEKIELSEILSDMHADIRDRAFTTSGYLVPSGPVPDVQRPGGTRNEYRLYPTAARTDPSLIITHIHDAMPVLHIQSEAPSKPVTVMLNPVRDPQIQNQYPSDAYVFRIASLSDRFGYYGPKFGP